MIIKDCLVLDPQSNREEKLDVRIKGSVISEIGADLSAGDDKGAVDATGLLLTPGFVDMHTHLRDLGQKEKEDIQTGSRAAAAGGYTTVLAMANTAPPTDTVEILNQVLQTIKEKACIQVLTVACVTKGMTGGELTDLHGLSAAGAAAFSDDGMPISNLMILRQALDITKSLDRLIISHPEDKHLSGGGSMNESKQAERLGLRGIPACSESACIAREIEVCRQTGAPLHFAHVSTEAACRVIANGKADGLPISADVTPHHLLLTDEEINKADSSFKMNPPLRSKTDQQALIKALKDGTIDAIATDHAPHTRTEKARPFDQAPFGVIGLETAFSLCYEKLVLGGHLSIMQLLRLLTVNPSKLLKLSAPSIKVGVSANLTLINRQCKWTYSAAEGYSKSSNSPFDQREMISKPVLTIYQGKTVYSDDTQIKMVSA